MTTHTASGLTTSEHALDLPRDYNAAEPDPKIVCLSD